MENSKIITIQDHKGFNRIDQGTYDGPITHYDLTYPDKLMEYFGIGGERVFKRMEDRSYYTY